MLPALVVVLACGATKNVSTSAQLQTALSSAVAGDELVLADGTYDFTASPSCSAAGTPSAPIVVRAANRLQALVRFNILEDVDLIAEERTNRQQGCLPLLFELLNQMDGLSDDADILFVLTTNRPDLLEPALKSRPGRIDLALEVPVPDAECRRRLFDLYGRGLKVSADLDPYIARTSGASAAFIRELLRKAALFAADSASGELEVRASHFDEALHEMVISGGELTKSLLGAAS